MIKKIPIVLFVLCTICMQSAQVQAALLSFDPPSQSVGLGDNVSVDLRISTSDDEILSGFDLDISFDDSILSFQGFTFGTGLDVLGLGSIQSVDDSSPGLVNVFELSLDFDDDLKRLQDNDFILGTFDFGTLNYGTSPLNVAFGLLSGADALALDMQVVEGSVSVVPVPAAIWLFGTGLVGLIGFSRRRKTFMAG